jgi:hypothetical protein
LLRNYTMQTRQSRIRERDLISAERASASGSEGAVPGAFVLVATVPVAISVIAVRTLATMNYCRRGHEVLVHVPRAHDGIVEPKVRYLERADLPDILL